MPSDSNKRIAKNTIYLYLRMIVTMVVTLYTVRVVLATLGESDYGIYNVIGGVVVLFSFMNTAMSNATQRFLSFEIGKNDQKQLARTFSMSVTCHSILAIVIFILAETIGLWFVYTQMNIPPVRLTAAIWVYQFSIATFIANILRVPYNASVISYEKMSFYAWLSVVEVFLNLGIVVFIVYSSFDKLILYAGLKFAISTLCWIVNYVYCRLKFECCKYIVFWDKPLFTKLLGFSGWSMLSGGSVLVTQNGTNILLNIFNGVTVNAAYGIANQVSAAIYGFVSNFQMAFQPQIVKLYAEKEKEAQEKLINRSAILSFYLLLIIAIPFIVNANYVLGLWLKNVPLYATEFCQWMLLYSLIDAIQAPLWMAINATGNIKQYSLWSSALIILNIPFALILLYFGYSPVFVFILRTGINFILAIIRILYVKSFLDFHILTYSKLVLTKAIPVMLCAFIPIYLLKKYMDEGISSLFATSIFSFILTIVLVLTVGLAKNERDYAIGLIRTKIRV